MRELRRYPSQPARVLIYPQATKYLATQRDPFSAQFDLFRRTLSSSTENVLAICGYLKKFPQVSIAESCAKTLSRFMQEFGLTPSARTRLAAPQPQDNVNDDKRRYLKIG